MTSTDIPANWLILGFDEVFSQISISGKRVKSANVLTEGKFPVVDQGRNFISGYLDDANLVVSENKPLIIFGDHTREIKWIDFPFIPGADGVQVLKPRPEMDTRFLYFFLRNLPIESRGYARHFKILKDAAYLVPPLAEQIRIAAKLDELLSQVDTLKARIDGIPALLKRFRQSVLAAAVSGRLTEKWRGGGDGDPDGGVSAPINWELTRLGHCIDAQNGKAFPSAEYQNTGVRLIRPGNLHVDGFVSWSDNNTVCLNAGHLLGNDRYLVRAGDIVMNLTAQSLKDDFLGRVCIYVDKAPALLNQRQCTFSFKKESTLTKQYLFWYFRSPQFRAFVDTLDSGSLIKHMYTKQLSGHMVAVPSATEQTEIVRCVEQLFTFADQLETRTKAAQARIDRLTQSILAKAFRGELVPQDPSDEPADVLLERIKAQRAAAPKAKRDRRSATAG